VWTYPPEFLESLGSFGLAPTASTPPLLVREAIDELYRYELRRLRERLRERGIEKTDYHDAVVALRKRYWLLTLSQIAWEKICRTA
jgi:hypothetical protein